MKCITNGCDEPGEPECSNLCMICLEDIVFDRVIDDEAPI